MTESEPARGINLAHFHPAGKARTHGSDGQQRRAVAAENCVVDAKAQEETGSIRSAGVTPSALPERRGIPSNLIALFYRPHCFAFLRCVLVPDRKNGIGASPCQ